MPLVEGSPLLDKAAVEVGHITFEWARLESVIGELMTHLLGINASNQEAHILDGNMDIREKIHATKGLAFLRHFDKHWLNATLALLDHVDNNLRVRRNAIIHAEWFTPRGRTLSRRTRKTKILRPQSFQLALETEQHLPVKIAELRRLRLDLQETWLGMLPVLWYMSDGDGLISPDTSPTLSWRRYLRFAGLGNPLRNVNSVRRRERKA
jgi:hypothetical protein